MSSLIDPEIKKLTPENDFYRLITEKRVSTFFYLIERMDYRNVVFKNPVQLNKCPQKNFGSTFGNKIDTSLFVRKPYVKTS